MKKILLTLAIFSTSLLGDETSMEFLLRGKSVRSLTLSEMEKISPASDLTVYEPHEDKEVTYRGFDLALLLDAVHGKSWREMGELLFTCVDGYQPEIRVEILLKNRAHLAFKRLDNEDFTIHNRMQNERVKLAPWYLTWDNLKSPGVKKEGAGIWPYQIAKVDLVQAEERFPKMAPARGASRQVTEGFRNFRKHCFACHKVNGEGGDKSFDLVSPVGVTTYFKIPWLRKWIIDPASMRPGTTMPGLGLPAKDAERVADSIIHYLRAKTLTKNP